METNIPTRSAEEVVRTMALVCRHAQVYGYAHSVTKNAVARCREAFGRVPPDIPKVSLNVTDDSLLINGCSVQLPLAVFAAFCRQLRVIEARNFTIDRQVSSEEFEAILELVSMQPEELRNAGGFAQLAEIAGLRHLQIQNVIYRPVAEGEVVADAGAPALVISRNDEPPMDDSGREDVRHFLVSDAGAPDARTRTAMQSLAVDGSAFSDLVVEVLGVDDVALDPEAGKTLARRMIRCLHRVYEVLKTEPSFGSQKGRRELRRTLNDIGAGLEQRIRAAVPEQTAAILCGAVAGEMEKINSEAKVEHLAAEYIKKRRAIEEQERRILRFIRDCGPEAAGNSDLRRRLADGGVSAEAWDQWVAKATGTHIPPPTDSPSLPAAPGRLGPLVASMMEQAGTAFENDAGVRELIGMIDEIEKEVNALADQVDEKMDGFLDQLAADGDADEALSIEEAVPAMSKTEVLDFLAEVVQELCQPLSVINCSISMALSMNGSGLGDDRFGVLRLASASGERLQALIEKLTKISGVPKDLTPNLNLRAGMCR